MKVLISPVNETGKHELINLHMDYLDVYKGLEILDSNNKNYYCVHANPYRKTGTWLLSKRNFEVVSTAPKMILMGDILVDEDEAFGEAFDLLVSSSKTILLFFKARVKKNYKEWKKYPVTEKIYNLLTYKLL